MNLRRPYYQSFLYMSKARLQAVFFSAISIYPFVSWAELKWTARLPQNACEVMMIVEMIRCSFIVARRPDQAVLQNSHLTKAVNR